VERMLEEGNCAQRLLRAIEGGATLEEAFAGEVRATRESALVEEVEEAHG
jgi:hypothetical protein